MHVAVPRRWLLAAIAPLLPVVLLSCVLNPGPAQVAAAPDGKPTLWLIGDSTVRCGRGDGAGNMWGWGSVIAHHFDPNRIHAQNRALGGTSSRSFYARGLWQKVIDQARPGDFVLMQFGHNDGGGAYDDTKARKSIRGNGDDTVTAVFPDGHEEIVHSYGWYLRQYIAEAKAKGVTPIVCSLIPRNDWTEEGQVARNQEDNYVQWAREAAEQTQTYFIDLNNRVADKYDRMGREAVKPFFPNEHTHTDWDGAALNAATVVEGIRDLAGCPLADYLMDHPQVPTEPPVSRAKTTTSSTTRRP
ncbi:rhamnogalacturonan acetylesterase [Candidatus Sumerlaeota bacterium]|nr:rhamnogalacturonan acetylesterase [Candidatus Sumerlaeota bacterium]